jgi:hypothetical protein
MPAPTTPTFFKSVIPLESFEDVAEAKARAESETAKIQEQRYQEVGTPAQLGARQAGRRAVEAARYLASLPTSDQYLQQTTGKTDQFAPVQAAAQTQLTESQKEYAKALEMAGEKPEPTLPGTPSWAKRTIT